MALPPLPSTHSTPPPPLVVSKYVLDRKGAAGIKAVVQRADGSSVALPASIIGARSGVQVAAAACLSHCMPHACCRRQTFSCAAAPPLCTEIPFALAGTDAMRDLAVLAIDGELPSEVQPLPVGASGDLKVWHTDRH